MTIAAVAAVRSFGRFYTNLIGVLRSGLYDMAYSVTEARVVFELAQGEHTEVSELRRTLDIDGGYLSRILRRLEADGIAVRERSTSDARRQRIRLTERGRELFAELGRRSNAQIEALLDGVGEADRARLVAAMGTIEDILAADRPARPSTVVLRPPEPGDLGWVVHRHGTLYAQEYGWDHTFEGLVARIVADYTTTADPWREAAWIAEVDGVPAGCVFCVRHDDETAQLRLLLVDPSARGAGIGGRLVEECLRFAKRAGYRDIVLWTNDVLGAARRIYVRAGFFLVSEEPHESFGHKLVGQYWKRSL